MHLSIRSKILLGFAIVLILSFSAQIISYNTTSQYILRQNRVLYLEHTRSAINNIQNFINKIEVDQLGIAQEHTRSNLTDYQRVIQAMEYTINQNRYLEKITILSKTGRELSKTDRFGTTPTDQLYFEFPSPEFSTGLSGKTAISKVYHDEKTSQPFVDVYTPIVTSDGKITAVVKGQVNLTSLWDIIAQVKLGNSGFAYVVDEDGLLIAHPNNQLVVKGENLANRNIIAAALIQKENSDFDYFYSNENGVESIGYANKMPELNWVVAIEQPKNEALAPLSINQRLFYLTFIGTSVVLFLVSFYLSDNFAKPIRKLTNSTQLLTEGNLDINVDIKTGDETQKLAQSFNIMAYKLKTTIEELREKVRELNQKTEQLISRDRDLGIANIELAKEKETAEGERNKLQVILAGITDGVIAVDLEHHIVLFNQAAQKMTNLRSSDVISKRIDEVFSLYEKDQPIDPNIYCPIRHDSFEGIVFRKENLTLRSPRKSATVNLITGKIRESGTTNLGGILTIHDISEEQELERMKLDFVSMAAHELRTPLTSLRGYLSFLQEDAQSHLSDNEKDYINRANISSSRLSDLIENLLAVSKIEQGKMIISPKVSSLETTVERVVNDFKQYADSKNLILTFHKPDYPLPGVWIDPSRIEEVLTNLIANALHFTHKGKIDVQINKEADMLVTSVRDTGIGIPSASLHHLFTKFFRIQSKMEPGAKGTGLGLYISKSIIEAHGGKIWAESTENVGTTFYFSLPIAVKVPGKVS